MTMMIIMTPRKLVHQRFIAATLLSLLVGLIISIGRVPTAHAVIADDGACQVISYFSYSKGKGAKFGEMFTESILPPLGYSLLAASELARQHFNERDASVVPELANLSNDCSVYIPEQRVVDGELSKETMIRSMLSELTTSEGAGVPCAVIGSMKAGDNDDLKEVTNAIDVPQVLYWEVHDHLLDRHAKNIISTVPGPNEEANIMLQYLGEQLDRKGVAIIHENPDLSADMAEAWVNQGPDYGMENFAFKRWSHSTTEELDGIIQDIKSYGLKTIFLNILSKSKTLPLAEAMDRAGMLDSNEYLFILPTHFMKLDSLDDLYGKTPGNSAWDKLLSNSMVFDALDGFRSDPESDRFLAAWRQQNATMVEYLNSIHPLQDPEDPFYYQPSTDFFQTSMPSDRAGFAYDAMMSVGLGACKALARSTNNATIKKSKNPVHEAILETNFTGATGFVGYEAPGRRTGDSFALGVYNIRSVPVGAAINGLHTHHSYEAVLTAVYKNMTGWADVPGTAFIYKDGMTVPPSGERDVQESNYLSDWVRILGFTFMGITWFFGLASMIGFHVHRKEEIVRRGQPFFLQVIAASSIIISTAILTLSFDEGSGWSNKQLNIACALTPWFFIIGQIVLVSCLWAKLWRVDKVLRFRRGRKVTVRQASTPILILLALALTILIVWTAVDPWTWERVFIRDYPLETYGACTCNNFWAYFGPLMGMVVFAEIMVIIHAWKSLDIAEDLGDSRVVFFTIFTQLQAWAVGVPILAVLGTESADGTYLGRVVLIWIFAISPLVLLCLPKLYRAIHLRNNPNHKPKRGSVYLSGLSAPMSGINNNNQNGASSTRSAQSRDKEAAPCPNQ